MADLGDHREYDAKSGKGRKSPLDRRAWARSALQPSRYDTRAAGALFFLLCCVLGSWRPVDAASWARFADRRYLSVGWPHIRVRRPLAVGRFFWEAHVRKGSTYTL